jgi:cardiolipin synthase A/B
LLIVASGAFRKSKHSQVMDWVESLARVWHYLVLALTLLLSLIGSAHALLHKRDTRAVTLWVGFIWFAPLIGAVLYFIFGVNRIKRQAIFLRGGLEPYRTRQTASECSPEQFESKLPAQVRHLTSLVCATGNVVSRPLLEGNRVDGLFNGDEAYPAMLEAIGAARTSVTLSTYIFDRDAAGLEFVRALGDAVKRGVEVRVLIDATGTRYSWPPVMGLLKNARVRYARFLPTFPIWQLVSLNLRNHRKILVVDGCIGFTGGLNIRIGHWLSKKPKHAVRDLHEVFADDWFFTTREALRGPVWFPALQWRGSVVARGIADGPDEDFEKLRWTILAALGAARHSVRIATPYFLPDPAIIVALNLAAMRGVSVHIMLPAKSNLPFVQWASTAHWWQLLERGCRIWLNPPPFDHTKVFIVDDCWALVGSANWDPRSLRLNFEFNVECYDLDLAGKLSAWFDDQLQQSHETTLQEVDSRNLAIRLRDGAARLLTPFL